MTMKKVTVDRSKWLRGEGPMDSFLLRATDGKMCCLGFVLQQAYGKTDDELLQFKAPSCTRRSRPDGTREDERLERPGRGTPLNSPDGYEEIQAIANAMEVNDLRAKDFAITPHAMWVTDEESRERRLIELLATVGIELEFVG